MCGRFTLITSKDRIKAQFGITDLADFLPQFNITPSQQVLTLVQVDNSLYAAMLKWGLIPFWSKDKKIGNKLVNARSETISQKPAFRNSFKSKRCLLLMSGYFEWQERIGIKQPYYFKQKDDNILAVAALWDSWHSPITNESIQSCCLLTTTANDLASQVHDRMPVLLNKEGQRRWLNHQSTTNELLPLLIPYQGTDLEYYPVSTRVNSSRYTSIDTVIPVKL